MDANKPVQVTVGGASGIQLDARVRSAPESTLLPCSAPECVLLFGVKQTQVNVSKGEMVRVIVLDVNGETVVIEMDAPARRWEAFLAEAEEVLATLQFG